MERLSRLKEKIANGQVVIGSHIFCGAPMLTEAIGLAGFDVLWIDMEHTAIGKQDLLNNIIAAGSADVCVFVRIQWNDAMVAKPVLDMGPEGVIFPYITCVEDAKRALAACTYPPGGVRGWGPLRALEYGRIAPAEYIESSKGRSWRILQIEHVGAVEALDAILDLPGIDALIVGPNDLAASMGRIGETMHDELRRVYDLIAAKAVAAKRPFGVSVAPDARILSEWIGRGAQLLFAGTDVSYVTEGATKTCGTMRGLCPVGRRGVPGKRNVEAPPHDR